ncbi:hypothetical protein HOA93_05125 [bacterium]|nr:hypothetical protein [bacterium]
MNATATINLNNTNINIENKPHIMFVFIKKTLIFTYNILRKIIHFIHISLDKFVALNIYLIIKGIGEMLFAFETWMHTYLKKSKYIKDDRFDPGIEHERIVMLGMGLKNVKKVTIREVVRENGVSEPYARKMLNIAKNYMNYYHEYADIWKDYTSDSEKRDKRSLVD